VPLLLARVDDRLIHGQVAFGWAGSLCPTWIAIVSDALRQDSDRAALYLLAAPEGVRAVVLSVAEALDPALLATIERERAFVLFQGPEEALRLREGGFPLAELNIGGLHFSEGRRPVLPFVYLDESDRACLRRLAVLGVRLVAQDLPTNPSQRLEPLLDVAG
jgi:mannose/fructose/N-acetylgalactosamine-specific phosphotransferase system component IIB